MKFDRYKITSRLKENIRKQGWKRPTDIQFKVIPPILKGEDVLAIAQTGTGKTAGFAIPLLNQIHFYTKKENKHFIRAIILVPTRELSEQTVEVFHQLGEGLNVRTIAIIGGVNQDSQIKALEEGVDIVVATPGRMFDLIAQKKLFPKNVKTLVLDEADHMLGLGFRKDIYDVKRKLPSNYQTLFFSATIDKKIKKIAYDLVRNAIRIQISPKNPVNSNIEHRIAYVEMDDKRFFLENIIKENEGMKIIVFVRTRVRSERVVKAMKRVGIEAMSLHGGIPQEERTKLLNLFREGEIKTLITTDVAAKGIDIPQVSAVVNYDLPDEPENYVHRIGRTGRGKEKGVAISFCASNERMQLSDIEKYIGGEIEEYAISKNDYKTIISDSDDETDDWRALIDKENKRAGTENTW